MCVRMAEEARLKPRGTISLITKTLHDPVSYYRSDAELWVWDRFLSQVVSKAKLTPAGEKFDVSIFELVHAANDSGIERALPTKHLFDESVVCVVVASMIAGQPNGEPGELEHTGFANLLYTRTCRVEVLFDSGPRLWRVLAWPRDNIQWDVGRRLLAPAP